MNFPILTLSPLGMGFVGGSKIEFLGGFGLGGGGLGSVWSV